MHELGTFCLSVLPRWISFLPLDGPHSMSSRAEVGQQHLRTHNRGLFMHCAQESMSLDRLCQQPHVLSVLLRQDVTFHNLHRKPEKTIMFSSLNLWFLLNAAIGCHAYSVHHHTGWLKAECNFHLYLSVFIYIYT